MGEVGASSIYRPQTPSPLIASSELRRRNAGAEWEDRSERDDIEAQYEPLLRPTIVEPDEPQEREDFLGRLKKKASSSLGTLAAGAAVVGILWIAGTNK